MRVANFKIAKLKRKERRHVAEKTNFNKIKALWEVERVSKPEIVSSEAQYFTWTVPAIKEARFVRMINVKLRATNRRLKRQIEDLEIQLTKSERKLCWGPVIWHIGIPNDKTAYEPSFRALGSIPPSLREGSLNMFAKI